MAYIVQLMANGLMAGATLALPAIAFNMIFAVLRTANFSIAAMITIGGYAGFSANVFLGVPPYAAIVIAFLATAIVGVAGDHLALRPLRHYGAISVAIASLALNMILENAVRFFFGNDIRALDMPLERDWLLGPIRVAPQQFYDFLIAAAMMVALFAMLRLTPLGKAMRAVADSPRLADIKGIDPEAMARVAVFIGAGLAGVSGFLLGLETAINTTMGMNIVLAVFASAVLGGLGSIPGAVVGAMVMGVAEELSVLAVPVAYRSAVGFFVIAIALLLFPRGILGNR